MSLVQNIYPVEEENKQIVKEYRALLRAMKNRLKKGDKERIREAFELSLQAHKDMRRKSGEPYILHPLAVARIVAEEIGLDATSIVCALLHDVVEDTELTLEDIEHSFGKQAAKIIDGLTKISGVFDLNSSQQAENFRKLLLTLTDDIRVILIKLADRLHNMRTLDSMSRQKQMKIASETLYLYAPLSHRMGLYNIKTELEDLGLKYTESDVYRSIVDKLAETKRERNRFINDFIKPIREMLDKKGVPFEIYGRPKSIFSIWNKMKKQGIPFEEVYDLLAIRIIVKAPEDYTIEKRLCWEVYSMLTDEYKPHPSRLRDWLTNPKSNGYEALHNTFMAHDGKWVEVQIRTQRMHEIAEKGVAAHWKYKEGKQENTLDNWLDKIRGILANPESDALDFLNDFKMDLFKDEIFVFTPKGDLRRLSVGSTALDFAFDIHSEVGKHCIGVKVNHKLVPLSYSLQNGDQVEILTSTKQKPHKDWLSIVKTGKSRTHIKQSLKDEKRAIAMEGKAALERKFNAVRADWNDHNLNGTARFYKHDNLLDLYFAIANHQLNLSDLTKLSVMQGKIDFPKIKTEKKETSGDSLLEEVIQKTLKKNAELLIMGESADKLEYKFASCCNPIPGDEVFGFVTVNEGIKIHRVNCPNAVQLMSKFSYRVVKTRWTNDTDIAFLTGVKVEGLDEVGVVNNVTNIITGQMKLNMRSISFDSKDGIFEGNIMVYVNNIEQLEELIDRMRKLEGVLSVSRIDSE